jgi:hypothetical protein
MKTALTIPTEERVRSACKEFDQDNQIVEQALDELFNQYPRNDKLSHVLLKVVTLNRLYSTQVLAVVDMAHHIHDVNIDSGLAAGSRSH